MGRADDLRAFVRAHGIRWTAAEIASTCFHFYKAQREAVACNDIDLVVITLKVPAQNVDIEFFQESAGDFFACFSEAKVVGASVAKPER